MHEIGMQEAIRDVAIVLIVSLRLERTQNPVIHQFVIIECCVRHHAGEYDDDQIAGNYVHLKLCLCRVGIAHRFDDVGDLVGGAHPTVISKNRKTSTRPAGLRQAAASTNVGQPPGPGIPPPTTTRS